jgi:hypothetical protein
MMRQPATLTIGGICGTADGYFTDFDIFIIPQSFSRIITPAHINKPAVR